MHTATCLVLTVSGLGLDLDGRRILSAINLAVRSGEFLGLIGPNGGGKTTLLRTLLGWLRPTQGTVTWAGPDCRPPRLGYVPQRVNVDPHFPLAAQEVLQQGAEGIGLQFGKHRREMQQ
ncbi:MAG: ATP-binding cassette domain-containing protein, partial [Verrucomicrobiae bacterium]|nr:ATP-binding cassette domain-containing protein [Verrucomicrobiae bacterium]